MSSSYHCAKIISCLLWIVSVASFPLSASEWRDVYLGKPLDKPLGSHSWANETLTVTGVGAGINVAQSDNCQFSYHVRPAGDWQIIARLNAITGEGRAVAGLMVRSDDASGANPAGAMAAVYYQAQDQQIGWASRVPSITPGAAARVISSAIKLIDPPPLWMKLVSHGDNVAAYKSRDGTHWSMISNTSGGPLALHGPVRIGCFVAGAPESQTASATFDAIALGAAAMPYKSSWVGSSFGCRDSDSHVSNGLSALWVAADGTCYTSSYWDEAHQPVTSYRNGKVVGGLPISTPKSSSGGITGDEQYVFSAWVDRVLVVDRTHTSAPPRPLMCSVRLYDDVKNHTMISGMASNGTHLFVADARENLVRVVQIKPVATFHVATAANDGIELAPGPVVVPPNDPRFAPALIYQSQRVGEGTRYTLPGLVAGASYTVRVHLAEYVKRSADCDPRNRTRAFNNADNDVVNVAELAGGVLRAAVKDLPGYVANSKGCINLETSAYGAPGICGIEVIAADGKKSLAINCGGPAIGAFTGECQEEFSRSFSFERPGAMTIDGRGDLWIVQRANDFPSGLGTATTYTASIQCFTSTGSSTGRALHDVVNPLGIAYDQAQDRLLVADNGPAQQIRIYRDLATIPVLDATFGQAGGVYSGANPGLFHDPAAGGDARFAGISGVGVDATGNLYVGGGFQGTVLQQFTRGTPMREGWKLYSQMFCSTYDVDPDSDGKDLYGTFNHMRLDLSKEAPGSEQSLRAYTWDVNRRGVAEAAGKSQAIVRRFGAKRQLVMYTTGQGLLGDLNFYRYEGQIAIPAGGTRNDGKFLWVDTNEDGIEDPSERTLMPKQIRNLSHLCIDTSGDMWVSSSNTNGSYVRHFPLSGMSAKGVPLYQGTADSYTDVRFPEEGDRTNAWHMYSRFEYDAARDIAITVYPVVARTGEGDVSPKQFAMARYDNWKAGNRIATWKKKVYTPYTDPQFFMYEKDFYPYSNYMGIQFVGDYVFCAYLFGEIHAFDSKTGALAQTFPFGPEVAGSSAWEDATMGLRAFRRTNGEYLIFTENSGWGGKNNFIRWKP